MNKIIKKSLLGVGFLSMALLPFVTLYSSYSNSFIINQNNVTNIDESNLSKNKIMEDEYGYFYFNALYSGTNNGYITFNLSKQNHLDKLLEDFTITLTQSGRVIALMYYFGEINNDINSKSWTFRASDFGSDMTNFSLKVETTISKFNEDTGTYEEPTKIKVEFKFGLEQLSYDVSDVKIETRNESHINSNDGEIIVNYEFPFTDSLYIVLTNEFTKEIVDFKVVGVGETDTSVIFENVPSGDYAIDFFVKDDLNKRDNVDINLNDTYSLFELEKNEFYKIKSYIGISVDEEDEVEVSSPIFNILNVSPITSNIYSDKKALEVSYYSENISDDYDIFWTLIDTNSSSITRRISDLSTGNDSFIIEYDDVSSLVGNIFELRVNIFGETENIFTDSILFSIKNQIFNGLIIKDVYFDYEFNEQEKVDLNVGVDYWQNKNKDSIVLNYELYDEDDNLVESGVGETKNSFVISDLEQDKRYKLILEPSNGNNTVYFEKYVSTPKIGEFEEPEFLINVVEEQSGVNISIMKNDSFDSIVKMNLSLYAVDEKVLSSKFIKKWDMEIDRNQINTKEIISTNISSSSFASDGNLLVGEIYYETPEGEVKMLKESNIKLNVVRISDANYELSYDLNEQFDDSNYNNSFTTTSQKAWILILLFLLTVVIISLSVLIYFVQKKHNNKI